MWNEKKPAISVEPFGKMVKTSVTINPVTGQVISETVLQPGQNKFDAIKEMRRKKLGL